MSCLPAKEREIGDKVSARAFSRQSLGRFCECVFLPYYEGCHRGLLQTRLFGGTFRDRTDAGKVEGSAGIEPAGQLVLAGDLHRSRG